MRIVCVPTPGSPPVLDQRVGHGENPRQLLWRAGWVFLKPLSAHHIDGETVITLQVAARQVGMRPPRRRNRVAHTEPQPGEVPVVRQREAAYGIVVSQRGLLACQNSEFGPAPGYWVLPGGGIEPGEAPADALLREINEETSQVVRITRFLDVQSDHWVGRAPDGRLEDFHALRVVYSAHCAEPTDPVVNEVDGTTAVSRWVSLRHWRRLQWTSGARSILDRDLETALG